MPSKPQEKAQVWILSRTAAGDARVLMLLMQPERGGFWQPVTGSVEDGEAIEAGALREAWEETGFRPGPAGIQALGYEFSFEGRWGRAHETVYYFPAADGLPTPTLDPKEHRDFRWVSFAEAEGMLAFPSNREALARLKRATGN